MMGQIPRFFNYILVRSRMYFSDEYEAIADSNRSRIALVSLSMLVLQIVGMPLSYLLIDGWEPSIFQILFLPVTVVLVAVTWLYKPAIDAHRTSMMTVLFEIVLYFFLIMMDTAGSPSAPSTYVQLSCVAFSTVFILPPVTTYVLLFAAEACYLVMVCLCKDPFIAQYDLFQICPGILCAVTVSALIMRFRLDEHGLRHKFEQLSVRDTLSNVLNKRAFYDKATAYIIRYRPKVTCSVAFLDLDDFKLINDTFGHSVGDRVLTDMGSILSELFRPNDIICRFGGDEFLILLDGLVDERIIRRRFGLVMERYGTASKDLTGSISTCSIGVVCAIDVDESLDDLILKADDALYKAKNSGKSTIEISYARQTSDMDR